MYEGVNLHDSQEPMLLPARPKLPSFWENALKLFKKPPNNVSRVAESLDYEPIQNELYFNRIRARKAKRHVYGTGGAALRVFLNGYKYEGSLQVGVAVGLFGAAFVDPKRQVATVARYSGLTLAKSIVVIMTGIITGLCALVITEGSSALLRWRNGHLQALMDQSGSSHLGHPFLFIAANGAVLAIFGGCMVTFWAPQAAGAGVSLVMAYLNGNHIPNLLRMRTLITKVVGTLCAVASGLAVGPEGPLIHIGACVASNIANANCNVFSKLFMPCLTCESSDERTADEEEGSVVDDTDDMNVCAVWEDLHEDSEHREFISAGAAAGLSAAFGSPIGGVLFSMEEACSFWSRKVAWRCFIAAILAAFMISQLASHGDTPIKFNNVRTLSSHEQLRQIPFMVLVSLIGGLLGAMFNHMRVFLWRFRASRSRPILRILELVLITSVCVCVAFFASARLGRCRALPSAWPDNFQAIRFKCAPGQHNDLATLFMAVPDDLLSRIFSAGSDDKTRLADEAGFSQQSLFIFAALYLVLMSLCAGTCIPAGLFMPSIMLGASVGLASGRVLQHVTPPDWEIQPGVYALICATAVLAGVFRSAISVVVIVVEGTRGVDFLFCVIIAVVVANWVADFVHKDGVYESELERDGNVFFLRHEPPNALSVLTAEQIMVRDPVSFTPIAPVKFVLEVLTQQTHHGFPVVAEQGLGSANEEGIGQLEGFILRSQLLVMLRERAFCDAQGRPLNATITRRSQYKIEREMRLFYRHRYTHHRYMATRDNDMQSLHAVLSQPEPMCLAAVDEANTTGLPSTSGKSSDGAAAVNVPPTPIAALDATTCSGSRNMDEMQELRGILRDMGAGSLLYLDLRLYMNTAPLTVRKEMSAARVHRTFVTLGMRHLCVTNHKNRIVGIVTRKDLDAAAGGGPWRRAALNDETRSAHGTDRSNLIQPTATWLPWLTTKLQNGKQLLQSPYGSSDSLVQHQS